MRKTKREEKIEKLLALQCKYCDGENSGCCGCTVEQEVRKIMIGDTKNGKICL